MAEVSAGAFLFLLFLPIPTLPTLSSVAFPRACFSSRRLSSAVHEVVVLSLVVTLTVKHQLFLA